jgi:hypothetical protein
MKKYSLTYYIAKSIVIVKEKKTMAVFAADSERNIALELKRRILAFYVNFAPVLQTVSGWTLNGADASLPTPFDVRSALEQYRALKLERIRQDDLLDLFLTAQLTDTLSISTAPIFFDGGINFDGGQP